MFDVSFGVSQSAYQSPEACRKHEQRKATAADTSGKQARRKAKKVQRQASKQQTGRQLASPPQITQLEPTGSQSVAEQQEVSHDDEPLLEAHFSLPEGFSLPTVVGSSATLGWLRLAPNSAAEGLGTPLPDAASPCADTPDAASALAGKRWGPESMSDAESSGTAEAPAADSLALAPLTRSNINNLKET